MNRSSMGKQMQTPPGRRPSVKGMKPPEASAPDTAMPDFKARAMRPGGMKKGGTVRGMKGKK